MQQYDNVYNTAAGDIEGGPLTPAISFDDNAVRHNFIRKVYGILTGQLLITMGVMALFMFCEPIRDWARGRENSVFYVLIGVFIALIAFVIVLACFANLRRKFPINFIFLGIFTILMSVCLGIVAALYEVNEVLIAIGITAIIVFALTVFAFQTKYDFTVLRAGLLIVLLAFSFFGVAVAIFDTPVSNLLYCVIGVILFSIYIIYDTQLMMGGKHKYSISPEEYILAALSLYLDIINLFLLILRLVGGKK